MGDGLEWSLELDAKTSGLDEMNRQLDISNAFMVRADDLSHAMLGELRALNEASARAGAGHKKHAEEAEHAEGALKRLVHAGIEPFLHKAKEIAEFEFLRRGVDKIIEAPGELIEKVKELGEEAILTAAKAERMELSFKLQLGAEGAEHVLGWIEKIASKTEFTDDQLKDFTSQLIRAGVATKDLDKYLAAAGDLAATGVDAASAISALSRASLSGHIEGRVLRMLNVPIKELGQLHQFRGMSEEHIRKALETTTISRADLLTVIAGPDKVLGDKMVEAGKTLSAQLTHLKDLPDQFFQKLSKSPGLDLLKTEMGSLLERLDPESPDGRRIFGALENAFKAIGDVMHTFDLADAIGKGIEAMETLTIMTLEFMSLIPGETGDKASFNLNNMKRRREQNRLDQAERKDLAEKGTTPEFETAADYAELDAAEKSGALGAKSMAYATAGGLEGAEADRWRKIGANVGQEFVEGARGPEGIDAHSPSKKFEHLGKMAAAGFAIGSDDDGAFAVPGVRPGTGGDSAGGGGVHVTVETTVHLHGAAGDARAQGQMVGDAANTVMRAELVRILEGMRTEMGSS